MSFLEGKELSRVFAKAEIGAEFCRRLWILHLQRGRVLNLKPDLMIRLTFSPCKVIKQYMGMRHSILSRFVVNHVNENLNYETFYPLENCNIFKFLPKMHIILTEFSLLFLSLYFVLYYLGQLCIRFEIKSR